MNALIIYAFISGHGTGIAFLSRKAFKMLKYGVYRELQI